MKHISEILSEEVEGMTQVERFQYAIDRAIEMTLKHTGIKPKTIKSKVTFNYVVTQMGIGRKSLDSAIRNNKVDAEFNEKNKRWLVDRKSVERHFNLI